MSRGRALRTGVAWSQKSGFKVRGRTLGQDGERPGIWGERSWLDEASPQRYVSVPPPDGIHYRPGPPAAHSIGAKVDLTWVMQSDTHVAGSDTQQPNGFPGVLRKGVAPCCFLDVQIEALQIGPPVYLTATGGQPMGLLLSLVYS